MAHFYGIVRGTTGEATRQGSKKSGLTTIAASYSGAVETRLYERDGVPYARVFLRSWQGVGVERTLYDGPVGG